MKNFLRGVICGGLFVFIATAILTNAQVDEPLTLRVPSIASDSTWTPQQRAALRSMFQEIVTSQNTVNRSFAGRMRQID